MKKMYIAPEVELLNVNVEVPMAASIRTEGAGGLGYGGTGDDSDDPGVKGEQDWDIWD